MFKRSIILKVVVSTILFVLLFTALSVYFIQNVILASFLALEKGQTIKSIERTKVVFDKQIVTLSSKLSDWATWDDSYEFIQDKNEEYIESNLTDESLKNIGIDAMIFIGAGGELFFEKRLNNEVRQKTPITDELVDVVLRSKKIYSFTTVNDKSAGVMQGSQGPVLFASRPILTSLGTGPVRGALIFIRYYDEEINSYLQSVNNNNRVGLQKYGTKLPVKYLNSDRQDDMSSEEYFAYPTSADTVTGFTTIYDFNGEPVYILKNEIPRSIYKQGVTTVLNFLFIFLVMSVAGEAFTVLLIYKFVLSKLVNLNKNVNLIKHAGGQLRVDGVDEFANLAININQLLSKLEASKKAAAEISEALEKDRVNLESKIEELEKFNKITVGRELKMVELKEALREAQSNIPKQKSAAQSSVNDEKEQEATSQK